MSVLATVSGDGRIQRADRLAIELSSELIRLPAGEIEKAVGDALRRIGEETGADRSTLIEFAGSGSSVRAAYDWAGDSLATSDDDAHTHLLIELLDRAGVGDEPILLDRIHESPPDNLTPAMADYLQRSATESAVLIPILTAGRRACALIVETVRPALTLMSPLVTRFRLLGEILAGALDRFRQAEA